MNQRLLQITGVFAMILAICIAVLSMALPSEKPGVYYAFGHNFDVIWEIALPMFVGGAAVIGVGLLTARRKRL